MGIPRRLLEQIDNNNVVPFIGAGFSCLFGYPTWIGLLRNIINELKINVTLEEIKDQNPLHIAEVLFHRFKNDNYETISEQVKSEFMQNTSELKPPISNYINEEVEKRIEEHFNNLVCKCLKKQEIKIKDEDIDSLKILNKLNFKNIVTTNYDDVLEKEILDNPRVLYPGSGKELINPDDSNRPILYKIHGDILESKSIILTNSQYYRFIHNEGYFKSKLYTFFASNTILMLGYSFGDINVQGIYFQFRNDYRNMLKEFDKDNPKVYLVIIEEKEKKEKYLLYKEYLNCCGIYIIDEYESIPQFLAELYKELKEYRQNKELKDLIPCENLTPIKNALTDVINNNVINVSETYLYDDYIKAVIHIFKYPAILKKEPFNVDLSQLEEGERIPENIGLRLLDSLLTLIENNPNLTYLDEYSEIIVLSLEFAQQARNKLNNFYYYPDRFERFMKLCVKARNFRLTESQQKYFSEMFGSALRYSGFEFGKCYGSAEIINREIKNVPEEIIKVYIDNIESKWKEFIKKKENENENFWSPIIGYKEIEWLKKFVELKCWSEDLLKRIDGIISDIEKNKAYYFGG